MNPCKLNDLDEHPAEEGMELHPLIELLIARMESNPQEFYAGTPSRGSGKITVHLSHAIDGTKALWNRKEKRLYNIALRKVRMQEAHELLMAAILAGN